ncbi:MAG: FIST N-terminal domain-containing protein [Desulfobacteraceae bacterium]
MIQAFSAASTQKDAFDAGNEATRKAVADLTMDPIMLWVFGAVSYDQAKLLDGVAAAAPNVPIIGCTTDGEISSQGLSVNSVVVMALSSDSVQLQSAFVENLSNDSFRAGAQIGKALKGEGRRYIQVFSDGLSGNADQIIQGIKSQMGDDVKIAGGTAGDGGDFKRTYQYFGNKILTDSIVAVAFQGQFGFGTGTACGWFPVGIAKKVTRAEGNMVYELDGQPALQAYERFLGKYAEHLPAVGVEYPLGLLDSDSEAEDEGYFLCRATMGVDRKAGAIIFAGDVPEGSMVKMTIGNDGDIIRAAKQAAQSAMGKLRKNNPALKPQAIFLYSCMARKIVLGSRTDEEIMAVKETVGEGVPIIGFYTYGEYAPIGECEVSCFHNETATLTVIGD